MIAPAHAASMVEDSAYHDVRDCIDMCCLFNFEERFARQFASGGVIGPEMLRSARGLIARALRRLADECERGWAGLDEDDDLRSAYLDAIGLEENGVAS